MTSQRTKKYKRLSRFLNVMSWASCFALITIFVITLVTTPSDSETHATLRENVGNILFTLGCTLAPVIVLMLIVKDKVKPLIWMINIVLSNFIWGSIGMYIAFGLWACETYIFTPLAGKARTTYLINKEIDLRGEV